MPTRSNLQEKVAMEEQLLASTMVRRNQQAAKAQFDLMAFRLGKAMLENDVSVYTARTDFNLAYDHYIQTMAEQ